MTLALGRALRYARAWWRDTPQVDTQEWSLRRDDRSVPATLYLPRGSGGSLPAWILLHGITRPGRAHPVLCRFAGALASSGAAVLVPEVPEWVELSLAPGRTLPTVRAALDALAGQPRIAPGPVGLVGFSFGAPQAVLAAGDPSVAERIAGVVGFGGYCDLGRTMRFLFTGEHEWQGRTRRTHADPYGRWIVAGNYLTEVPGFDGADAVAEALLALAREAGEFRTPAWHPRYDPLKLRLREALTPDMRELFDLFAPLTELEPVDDSELVRTWVARLLEAAHRTDPLTEPVPLLGDLRQPVHLLHGRTDRLIPFTESLRLGEHLAKLGDAHTTVTRLFAHSSEDEFPRGWAGLREGGRFVTALARILAIV